MKQLVQVPQLKEVELGFGLRYGLLQSPLSLLLYYIASPGRVVSAPEVVLGVQRQVAHSSYPQGGHSQVGRQTAQYE